MSDLAASSACRLLIESDRLPATQSRSIGGVGGMDTVVSSTKHRVVTPRSVRRFLGIKSGMRARDRIESQPLPSPCDLRGFLKGMGSEVNREEDRL